MYLFKNSIKFKKDLVEIQYSSNGRPEQFSKDCLDFPVWIDLSVIGLVNSIEGSARGEHIENSYSLLFDIKEMESGDPNVNDELFIPLLITPI